MSFFDGDKKLGEVYQGRGVQACWAGVNGVPPLIHVGDRLCAKFHAEDRGKCDKIFGYSFVVNAVFHERDLPVDEQHFSVIGSVIKNELKRFLFKRLLDSIAIPHEKMLPKPVSGLEMLSNQGSTFFQPFSRLLAESWNCDAAVSFLRLLYSSTLEFDAGNFLSQTLSQIPLNYETKTLRSLLNHHSISVPQLHFSSLRSSGARISENLRSFVANPCKDGHTAFAITEEVFYSGLHEFCVIFEVEGPHSSKVSTTDCFGIGVASSAAVDLASDGIFFLNSAGLVKLMGGQAKSFDACPPPHIDQPIFVTLNMTTPKISIRQLGRVLLEQNLPPSLTCGGVRPLFIIESSLDASDLTTCRATIQDIHCPDSSDLIFIDLLGSIVSHKLTSEMLAVTPELQSIQQVIASNFECFKAICGLVSMHIPESDIEKRNFWKDLSNSLSSMQLLFLHSCLQFFHISETFARFLPLIKASFDEALSNTSFASICFEIQVILVLVAVASRPPGSSTTISSILGDASRESPLKLSMHQSVIGATTIGQNPYSFLSRALDLYVNIENGISALSSDAIVQRSMCELAKREVADSIVSRYFFKENTQSGSVMESFFSQLGSGSQHQLRPLLIVLSSIPSHCLQRSILPSLATMCEKLLTGQCSYSRDAIDFVTYILCVASKGGFAASRRALKHVQSSVSSVCASPGLNFIEVSQAAVSSVCPLYAAILNLQFNDCSIMSLVNAGWAVVAVGDRCVRISVASACTLCAIIQNNGGSCATLSRITGIPQNITTSCLGTLSQLRLVQFCDASDDSFVPTDLCSIPKCSSAFAPVNQHFNEFESLSECNFTDNDYVSIVQGILAVLPHAAFIAECELTLQCAGLTSASPGKISHVLTYLEHKGLIVREGKYVALLSHDLEHSACQDTPFDTSTHIELPNCILQLVIAVPSFKETYLRDSSISCAVCIPRSKFETFLGQAFSHILPLSRMDQLQLSDVFIESDACVATILFSLHGNGASAPQEHTRSEFLVSKGFCPTCLEDDQDLICPPCGHGTCFVCWQGYISTALQDNNTQTVNQGSGDRLHITKLKCIADHACEAPLSIDFLSRVSPTVASSMVGVLQKSMCRSILSASPAIVQCQFCDFVIVAANELCEALCTNCGRIKAIGDFKRNSPDQDWISHPNLKSGDLSTWQAMNQQGSIERFELMRFKKCPRCGAATTRCGCEDGKVICDGLEKCPNERCDQCSPLRPLPRFCLIESHRMPQHDLCQLQIQLVCAALLRHNINGDMTFATQVLDLLSRINRDHVFQARSQGQARALQGCRICHFCS